MFRFYYVIFLFILFLFPTVYIYVIYWYNHALLSSYLNPLHAKFFRMNKNIYLHFMSFPHINMTQIVEILSQVRQGPTYST